MTTDVHDDDSGGGENNRNSMMQQITGGQFLAITVAAAIGFFLWGYCGYLVGRQKLRDNPADQSQRAFGILACIWGVFICVAAVGLACFGIFGVVGQMILGE